MRLREVRSGVAGGATSGWVRLGVSQTDEAQRDTVSIGVVRLGGPGLVGYGPEPSGEKWLGGYGWAALGVSRIAMEWPPLAGWDWHGIQRSGEV